MENEKSESAVAQSIRELMQKRSITNTDAYLAFLEEQKETKRKKSEAHMKKAEARVKEAELELKVIRKMRSGEL